MPKISYNKMSFLTTSNLKITAICEGGLEK